MTPGELFQAGKLNDAITAALDTVKKKPTDTDARGQLVELLFFSGDLERADKQLETIAPAGSEGPGWYQLAAAIGPCGDGSTAVLPRRARSGVSVRAE